LAVEDSAYGTVVTYPGAKHLGTAHFLEVPGHPGEIEKENVTDLRFYLDDQPLQNLTDSMSISGKSFRVERVSKIRTFDLDSVLDVRDGVVMQSAHLRAPVAVDLQVGNVAREARDVRAAWLRFPEFILEPLDQRYSRLDESAYRYESAGGSFVRTLRTNPAGFVVSYPGLWEMVEP